MALRGDKHSNKSEAELFSPPFSCPMTKALKYFPVGQGEDCERYCAVMSV